MMEQDIKNQAQRVKRIRDYENKLKQNESN